MADRPTLSEGDAFPCRLDLAGLAGTQALSTADLAEGVQRTDPTGGSGAPGCFRGSAPHPDGMESTGAASSAYLDGTRLNTMRESSTFTDAIRGVARDLSQGGHTHDALNRASSAIDHLGRRLHGFGYSRAGEIADCFTAALADLHACHDLPEERRGEAVGRAVDRLEAALDHAAAGVLPDPSP